MTSQPSRYILYGYKFPVAADSVYVSGDSSNAIYRLYHGDLSIEEEWEFPSYSSGLYVYGNEIYVSTADGVYIIRRSPSSILQ